MLHRLSKLLKKIKVALFTVPVFGKLKCFAFLSTLFESCPGQIVVIVCSLEITVQSLQDLAYISAHSTWILLVLDPLIDCVHWDTIVISSAGVIIFSFTRQHATAPYGRMGGGGAEKIPLRTRPSPCLAPDTCGWSLWEGRVKVTCLLRATAQA